MTWHIYASDGRRAEWCSDPAWGRVGVVNKVRDYLGFEGQHQLWRPRWFATRMARGWRPAAPEHKRFPNIAALEMWIRHVGAPHGR